MKHITFSLVFILLLFIVPQNSSGLKIQIADNWLYEDSSKLKYNETAIDNIQMASGNNVVSIIEINTTRAFSFPYQKTILVGTWGNIIFDLSPDDVGLFVTQEGGITLFSSGNIFGKVSATILDNTKYFDITEVSYTILSGDPSLALISTSSEIFSIQTNILDFESDNGGIIHDIHYRQDIIISTNSNPSDTIKNYILTPILVNFEFNWKNYLLPTGDELFNIRYTETIDSITEEVQTLTTHYLETKPKTLNLSQENIGPAQQYTFEDGTKFPTYIKQTEPVKTIGLSLSQDIQEVEYFLVQDDEIDETTSKTTSKTTSEIISSETIRSISDKDRLPFGFTFLISLMLIPIIKKRYIS